MRLENIKSLVELAYENVPLYRRLYGEKPELENMEDFSKLPCLTRSDFVLCEMEDVLSNVDEAEVILPPMKNQKLFPYPRLESAWDRDYRYEVFYFLLSQVGIADDATFLIITDTSHSYYCGEMVANLLYFGHPTWMIFLRDHSDDEIQRWIDKFEPDCILLGLDHIPDSAVDWGVPSIFTINQYYRDMSSGDDLFHFDIYAVTEIGWIGIRLPGGCYMYPAESFYIEANPQDNILTITSLRNTLQPFIRYRTPDRGAILGDGKFQIAYIGEH